MAKARKTISVDDLWNFERVGALALSPDGAQAVCTLQRFSMEENKGQTSLWLLSTFGGGPRQCIGDQFAWMEGVLILAVLLEKFTPQLTAPGYEADIHPMITLRPRGGMPLVFAKA